ncbi:hypothetical protein RIF29_34020 [Crotalaria pallida]|uniref:Reverse transcriptase n=1 Tax=Crotalaria pallida TaxID=3830 RepID=A0AAN9HT52_CROPI
MEKLDIMISESVTDGGWKPVQISKGGPKISHLFFTDDYLLFMKAKASQVRHAFNIIQKFCRASGLKLALFNSVVTALPVYPMQVYWLPRTICNSLDVAVRNFLWGKNTSNNRGFSWVGWDKIACPKSMGGLGIRKSRLANISLLRKLIRNLIHDKQKLWVQILSHKYLGSASVLQARNRSGVSYTWRSICKVVTALKDGFRIRLGGGDVSFWYDKWIDEGPLYLHIPFVDIQDSLVTVRDIVEDGIWRLDKLVTMFQVPFAEKIQAIPVNTSGPLEDTVV